MVMILNSIIVDRVVVVAACYIVRKPIAVVTVAIICCRLVILVVVGEGTIIDSHSSGTVERSSRIPES
jgi:hypothetical protein